MTTEDRPSSDSFATVPASEYPARNNSIRLIRRDMALARWSWNTTVRMAEYVDSVTLVAGLSSTCSPFRLQLQHWSRPICLSSAVLCCLCSPTVPLSDATVTYANTTVLYIYRGEEHLAKRRIFSLCYPLFSRFFVFAQFLILATDGVWDVTEIGHAVQIVQVGVEHD